MLETRDLLVIRVLQSGHFDSEECFKASRTQEEQKIWQQGVEHGNENTFRLKVSRKWIYQIGQESSWLIVLMRAMMFFSFIWKIQIEARGLNWMKFRFIYKKIILKSRSWIMFEQYPKQSTLRSFNYLHEWLKNGEPRNILFSF